MIVAAGFSLSSYNQRYSHPTPWRSTVGDPGGSSGKIVPTGEKLYLEAVWKAL